MGVIVKENGYYQSWLSGLLCCIAAVGSDEHPAERNGTRSEPQVNGAITHRQPYPHPPPAYSVSTSFDQPLRTPQSTGEGHWDSIDEVRQPTSFLDDRRQLPVGTTPVHDAVDQRPISRGRLTLNDQSLQDLVPLKLAPIVLQDDHRGVLNMSARPIPTPHSLSKDSRSAIPSSRQSASVSHHPKALIAPVQLAYSGQRYGEDAIELSSVPNAHGQYVDRPGDSSDTATAFANHVPAVAPSMHMEVRSETLNDIGSAFSRPVTARSDHKDFEELLNDNAATVQASKQLKAGAGKTRSRSSSRVSVWLNGMRPAQNTEHAMPELTRDTHAVQDRTASVSDMTDRSTSRRRSRKHSQPSWSSVATNSESLPFTNATSPIIDTHIHSRSETADSNITAPWVSTFDIKPYADAFGVRLEEDSDHEGVDPDRQAQARTLIAARDRTAWHTRSSDAEEVGVAL